MRVARPPGLLRTSPRQTWTPSSSPTVGPTPTRTRTEWRVCTPDGTRSWPPTAATTVRRLEPSRSRVTRAAGPLSRAFQASSITGSVRLSLAVPLDHRTGGVRPGTVVPSGPPDGRGIAYGCGDHPGDRCGHQRDPGPPAGVPALCDEFGIVMIAEEVM